MIDPNYPRSPLDPPFARIEDRESGAFRLEGALVVHGENAGAWLRSTDAVEARR
ncbi:MAG: hypothetical protein QXG03_03330 [Halalkalicoccus sp.]